MIIKPRAKKFRIRRSGPVSSDGDKPEQPIEDDGFGSERFPTAAPDDVMGPDDIEAEGELNAIRREGLTGRQLRTARRVSQRNGIAATSDFDAVRQLRRAGIDPFQRANMLELVVSESQNLPATTDDRNRLPQTVRPGGLPSTEQRAEETRVRDIMRIQMDLQRRRRRRSILLVARLCFFVLLPTFLAGYYYYVIATPFYAATSAFVINKNNGAGAGGAWRAVLRHAIRQLAGFDHRAGLSAVA